MLLSYLYVTYSNSNKSSVTLGHYIRTQYRATMECYIRTYLRIIYGTLGHCIGSTLRCYVRALYNV